MIFEYEGDETASPMPRTSHRTRHCVTLRRFGTETVDTISSVILYHRCCYDARMAAVSNATVPEVIDLRQLREGDLDRLLEEEGLTWRSVFNWDSSASADL